MPAHAAPERRFLKITKGRFDHIPPSSSHADSPPPVVNLTTGAAVHH